MKKGSVTILAGLAILLVLVFGVILKSQISSQIPNKTTLAKQSVEIKVGDAPLRVSLAKTDQEITKGLSETAHLDENEGMLFVFQQKNQNRIFWMKDMLISIDIIWIKDMKVVQIDKSVPAPAVGTPNASLKLYPSNQAIDYALEVNAGFSDKNKITVGSLVDLSGI